jgi:hypothetical protein
MPPVVRSSMVGVSFTGILGRYPQRTKSMAQSIKRGIIQSFDNSSYTASVLLLEATSTFLTGVPVGTTMDGTSAVAGAYCAVLFFDEHNPLDAVVIAVYPNGASGVPTPPPGRVVFTTPYLQLSSVVIASGATSTLTVNTGGSNLPAGILGILYKAFFTSPSVGAFLQLGPHGSTLAGYDTLGDMPVANGFINGSGVLPVDASGKLDIAAHNGNATVTLYTYGYVV